ncbi:MAG: hypothetical protein EBR82_79590 [Caulobacteraceae bacterium]|nr:hypothetical protein [Caulobacteraceae bacterium]
MSLDKTAERRKKVIEQNRRLRKLGLLQLTEPGPWYPIANTVQFDPAFFNGFTEQQTGIDTPPAK